MEFIFAARPPAWDLFSFGYSVQKSLSSEGAALWIALTWPSRLGKSLESQGMAMVADLHRHSVTGALLCSLSFSSQHLANRARGNWLVLFGRSMAEKAVTLVSVPSSSANRKKFHGAAVGGAARHVDHSPLEY